MNSPKMTTFGGLLAVALVAGLASAPAHADTFVWVSDGSGGTFYSSSPSYSSLHYSSYSPSYSSSYSRVSYYESTSYTPTYYSFSYTSDSPSYYSSRTISRVYTTAPVDTYYSRVYYSSW